MVRKLRTKEMKKFKLGYVCFEKANPYIRVVILKVKPRFFNRPQKYKVRWFNNNEFHSGTAFEHELELWVK